MPTAATLAGIATIKGFTGLTGDVTYTGIVAVLTPLTGDLNHEFDTEELKDADGNIITLGATNPTEEYQLEMFIKGDAAAGPPPTDPEDLVKPTPLQVITISGLPYTEGNGTFNYVGGFTVKQSENFAKVSLRVKRFAGAELAVLV